MYAKFVVLELRFVCYWLKGQLFRVLALSLNRFLATGFVFEKMATRSNSVNMRYRFTLGTEGLLHRIQTTEFTGDNVFFKKFGCRVYFNDREDSRAQDR